MKINIQYPWQWNESMTRVDAARFSLQKWEELLKARKRVKKIDESDEALFDHTSTRSCALCCLFHSGQCRGCPLFEIGQGCVMSAYAHSNLEPRYKLQSPYEAVADGNKDMRAFSVRAMTRMVKALRRALVWAEKNEDGTLFENHYQR